MSPLSIPFCFPDWNIIAFLAYSCAFCCANGYSTKDPYLGFGWFCCVNNSGTIFRYLFCERDVSKVQVYFDVNGASGRIYLQDFPQSKCAVGMLFYACTHVYLGNEPLLSFVVLSEILFALPYGWAVHVVDFSFLWLKFMPCSWLFCCTLVLLCTNKCPSILVLLQALMPRHH